jgi:hypothetical protein
MPIGVNFLSVALRIPYKLSEEMTEIFIENPCPFEKSAYFCRPFKKKISWHITYQRRRESDKVRSAGF